MTGRLTDRNCNHNDGHSEKDLPFPESADDCRPIAGDFHPRQTNRPRYCYADTRNTFPNHAFKPRRRTAFPSLRHSPTADCSLRFRDSTHRTPEFHCKRTDTFASSDFLPIYNANIGMARYVKCCIKWDLQHITLAKRAWVGMAPKSPSPFSILRSADLITLFIA